MICQRHGLAQGWGTPGTRAELSTRAIWLFNFLGDESWTLADVMAFFALHLILGRKLDISGRDDLIFCSSQIFSRENANCRLARGKIWPIILVDFGSQIEKFAHSWAKRYCAQVAGSIRGWGRSHLTCISGGC